jgi:hypothetical protein
MRESFTKGIITNYNSEKYITVTRQPNNFYQPTANFSVYHKGVYCIGISVFDNLLSYIKDIIQGNLKSV